MRSTSATLGAYPDQAAHGATRPPAFQLSNIRYRYPDGRIAVDGVSLSIEQGERVALMGANGCGKSTLLKLLNGLIWPESGDLYALGVKLSEHVLRDQETTSYLRRRMGFIFQNPDAQLFCQSVREELAFGPLQLDLSHDAVGSRVSDVASLLGISHLLDRPPYQLSGGEKKKVALGSVLTVGPDILLMDEPTGGLDPRSRGWFADIVVQLHAAGKTLVTATHDMDLVPSFAERVIVMNEAHQIAASGPTQSMLADTALLQSVNLIHEHVHSHGSIVHSHPHTHAADHQHSHEV